MINPTVENKNILNRATANSLQEYLKIIEPDLLNKLVSAENWQQINAIALYLPNAITNFFGFEYRLGNNTSTDFLLCASAGEAGQKVLGDRNYSIKLPEHLQRQAGWQNLFRFSTVWNQSDSVLNNVTNVWLEFDVDESAHLELPIPSLFFGLNPHTQDYQWVTQTALPTLFNTLSQPVIDRLNQCFQNLPQTAHIFQIGVMLARKTDAVRVCLRNIKPGEIGEFLTAMNWQGNKQKLSETLTKIAGLVDRIDLDIDVGETIYPKIGLECYIDKQPALQPKWQTFFKQLTDWQLCILAKQEKLLSYPGFVRQRHRPELWANNLRQLEQFMGSQFENIFFRGLHHIKLSYQDDRLTEAKAYLYVSHSQINSVQLQLLKQNAYI